MTMTEIKTAKKLLAEWVDGGQKLFYTLEEVAGFIQERESAAQSR
jgi:hypothetical protein